MQVSGQARMAVGHGSRGLDGVGGRATTAGAQAGEDGGRTGRWSGGRVRAAAERWPNGVRAWRGERKWI
jgi:hypothetical protein